MTLSIQITKFKSHQYRMRAVSPNLMLAKVTCYTVHGCIIHICNVITYHTVQFRVLLLYMHAVYMLEIALRIIGLGFYDYFRKIWNT